MHFTLVQWLTLAIWLGAIVMVVTDFRNGLLGYYLDNDDSESQEK